MKSTRGWLGSVHFASELCFRVAFSHDVDKYCPYVRTHNILVHNNQNCTNFGSANPLTLFGQYKYRAQRSFVGRRCSMPRTVVCSNLSIRSQDFLVLGRILVEKMRWRSSEGEPRRREAKSIHPSVRLCVCVCVCRRASLHGTTGRLAWGVTRKLRDTKHVTKLINTIQGQKLVSTTHTHTLT